MKKFITGRLLSFGYAARGIRAAFGSEHNMKLHVLAAIVALVAAWWFRASATEWALVVFAIGLVCVAELFNTAIAITGRFLVHPAVHPLAGKVKDIAAGAVLMAAITAFVIACIVFGKHIVAIV